tara:strand:+ start:8672 stop:8800 length:129 start_codon:yes stop_codon:yes gene_type:complete
MAAAAARCARLMAAVEGEDGGVWQRLLCVGGGPGAETIRTDV